MSAPTCPYCGGAARLVGGAEIYRRRKELWEKRFWKCDPCAAWVGCHAGSDQPLGRLANAELRRAKQAAHAAFDPIWEAKVAAGGNRKKARNGAYAWLARELGIDGGGCHIGFFDEETCWRVVEICKNKVKANAEGQ